jgi:hypothetical protein
MTCKKSTDINNNEKPETSLPRIKNQKPVYQE